MNRLSKAQRTIYFLFVKGMTDEDIINELEIGDINWFKTIDDMALKLRLRGRTTNHLREFIWGYVPREYV